MVFNKSLKRLSVLLLAKVSTPEKPGGRPAQLLQPADGDEKCRKLEAALCRHQRDCKGGSQQQPRQTRGQNTATGRTFAGVGKENNFSRFKQKKQTGF